MAFTPCCRLEGIALRLRIQRSWQKHKWDGRPEAGSLRTDDAAELAGVEAALIGVR